MRNILILTVLAQIGIGCAHVPNETAVLSAQLNRELAQAKQSHLNLIDEYIHQRKERTETFLHYVWIPRFIKNFLRQPVVAEAMDEEFCRSNGAMDRALVIQEVVEAVSKKVEQKRRDMFRPIRKAKRELTQRVRDHYAQAERMNRTITLNIRSVVRGQGIERDIRSALSKPLNKIVPLDKTSEKLDKLLKLAEEMK